MREVVFLSELLSEYEAMREVVFLSELYSSYDTGCPGRQTAWSEATQS